MTIFVLTAVLMLGLAACQASNDSGGTDNSPVRTESGQSAQSSVQADGDTGTKNAEASGTGKVLIAYFAVAQNSETDAVSSASVAEVDGKAKGLVQIIAEDIQTVTGGDLFSIETSVDYPGDINDLIDYASAEQKEDARPELISHIENLDEYDTVFVGYPLWWYDLPQVMYSFFDEYDFSGKTIVPFDVHNGSRLSGTAETIQELEPKASVITDGFAVSYNDAADAADDVQDWLNGLGY